MRFLTFDWMKKKKKKAEIEIFQAEPNCSREKLQWHQARIVSQHVAFEANKEHEFSDQQPQTNEYTCQLPLPHVIYYHS